MQRSGSAAPLRLSRLDFRSGGTGHEAGEQRGVSPVIGIVLMLAVTISLAMLIIPLVFSVAGDTADSAPSASFSYSYTEAVGGTIHDDFGQTGTNADGILRIDLKTGDDIDASQLHLEATVSGGNWVDDTDPSVYDVGDKVSPGDSISVWANRGERVEVIWTDSAGKESAILADFDVAPAADAVPPGAPTPTDDCQYVDDNINNASTPYTLTIDGAIVQCDLDSYHIDELTIQNGGGLIGQAVTDDDVTLTGESQVWGDVDTDFVVLSGESAVNGRVTANTDFDSTNSEVDGRVDTGSATLDWGTKIRLRLTSDNPVTMDSARVGGDIIANDDVTLGNSSVVEQDVELDPSTSTLGCLDDNTSTISGQGCEEYASADFQLSIEETSEPLEDGEEFNATVEVANEGYRSGSQTIGLSIDGTTEDTQTVSSLAAGDNQSIVLRWNSAPKGNYTVKINSSDDAVTRSLRVYETDEAPRIFDYLNVTTTISSDNITEAVFDWETDREANITFNVTRGGTTEDSATVTEQKSNTTTLNSLTDVALPAYIRANIHNGDCYEYQINSGEAGQEYDLLQDGWKC